MLSALCSIALHAAVCAYSSSVMSSNSNSTKKDICIAAQNLTGVKRNLGKTTQRFIFSIPKKSNNNNNEKRKDEAIDSERRRAEKNGNTKNWIRVWNMHVRIFLFVYFLWTRVSRGMHCFSFASLFHLFKTFETLWIYQCWHFSCISWLYVTITSFFTCVFFCCCSISVVGFIR